MKKLTDSEAKGVLLAQELLATDALPPMLQDALKMWLLGMLDVAVVPSWAINGREIGAES